MKLGQSVSLGGWILVALNLVMAFGSIWIFMRMAPAIEVIIDQNEGSLQACEEMLSYLALAHQPGEDMQRLKNDFSKALNRATNNITEKEEPEAIETIRTNYARAFEGRGEAKKKTISAIRRLGGVNRNAMVVANRNARQFGYAGAWGIVFMASAVFMAGMLFMRGLKRSLVKPLKEIHSVIQAVQSGDGMRRCTGPDAPRDIKVIFSGINDVLDNKTFNSLNDAKRPE